jgi:hypothetical protein
MTASDGRDGRQKAINPALIVLSGPIRMGQTLALICVETVTTDFERAVSRSAIANGTV